MMTPPGYLRVRILLKPVPYANGLETLAPGRTVTVDEHLAQTWIREQLAELVPEPKLISTTCPKCAAPMQYAETPAPDERWVQCQNPRCRHGWLR